MRRRRKEVVPKGGNQRQPIHRKDRNSIQKEQGMVSAHMVLIRVSQPETLKPLKVLNYLSRTNRRNKDV